MSIENRLPSLNHLTISSVLWSFFLFLTTIFSPYQSQADELGEFTAAILVSRHIKPYMDALKGLADSMDNSLKIIQKTYILDQYDLENPAMLSKQLAEGDFDIIVSIGPEATSLAWSVSAETGITTVHSMVLNPDALTNDYYQPGCGISLGIPVNNQLEEIRKVLPDAERLGILYDPELNSFFVAQAIINSLLTGPKIIPLDVSSSRQIPDVLRSNWQNIDALWLIPDQTVISQTLVEYIIKEALFQKKPVVGYNRFFYDSGAAVAFSLDFQQIGRQTGTMAINQLKGLDCEKVAPYYEVLINHRVMQNLGLSFSEVSP